MKVGRNSEFKLRSHTSSRILKKKPTPRFGIKTTRRGYRGSYLTKEKLYARRSFPYTRSMKECYTFDNVHELKYQSDIRDWLRYDSVGELCRDFGVVTSIDELIVKEMKKQGVTIRDYAEIRKIWWDE